MVRWRGFQAAMCGRCERAMRAAARTEMRRAVVLRAVKRDVGRNAGQRFSPAVVLPPIHQGKHHGGHELQRAVMCQRWGLEKAGMCAASIYTG